MSSLRLNQIPGPGEHRKYHAGDVLHLELQVWGAAGGIGEVRTNLGRLRIHLTGVMKEGSSGNEGGGSAEEWHDILMRPVGAGRFVCDLPLAEVGTFEVKCFYRENESAPRQWVAGENLQLRVEPANTAAHNAIYNAFVRQFGPNRSGGWRTADLVKAENVLDSQGYTVLPPSGHFRDFKEQIPFVIDQLGFRMIQLLPIQPTPTSYGRMGRSGSPFAPTDYFSVDPSLAAFDRKATPMDQFEELVDCIHAHDGLVLLDLPIDHTGWASTLQLEHPEWFCHEEDGSIASPGAWGVVWEDLCKLDFSHLELWDYLAEVFLHWVRHGVDGFRCDAGYMVPRAVWRHIVARVRLDYPEVIFFLEGLGGKMETTYDLLDKGGMNWAYTELFQVTGSNWVKEYLSTLFSEVEQRGVWVNFAETHDNNRLAATGRPWAKMRIALAALTSSSGAGGMANGVEWLATEKIDVHGAASLNWGAPENLVDYISTLNQILRHHPAFGKDALRRLVGGGSGVGVLRTAPEGDTALAILNVEEREGVVLEWLDREYHVTEDTVDLLTGQHPKCSRLPDGRWSIRLAACQCLCLSEHPLDWWKTQAVDGNAVQRMREHAERLWIQVHGYGELTSMQVTGLLKEARVSACQLLKAVVGQDYVPAVFWRPGQDERREVMLPAGHFLVIRCQHAFRASLELPEEEEGLIRSFRCADGSHQVVLFPARAAGDLPQTCSLRMEEFTDGAVIRREGTVVLLPGQGNPQVPLRVYHDDLTPSVTGICTNEFGGYCLARGRWGDLQSKYDALLAAGLSPTCPVDRVVALSRCRGWVVYRDVSVELEAQCEDWFNGGYDGVLGWRFTVPMGFGGQVVLEAQLEFQRQSNGGCLTFRRLAGSDAFAGSGEPVTVIIRPDVDWRSNHQETKAYAGAEQAFPSSVHASDHGFRFAPYGAEGLWMRGRQARFFQNSEWAYQVALPEDAQRGLPGQTDVFSPGYFRFELKENQQEDLELGIGEMPAELGKPRELSLAANLPLGDCLLKSLPLYLARRDENRTVIAGFPWFLDWGRDTLICLRGLVAAGNLEASRDIIRAFAGFEEGGTIPNMIRGKDSGDRATSDAPLWLLVAAEDLVNASGEQREELLNMDCQGRPLKEILENVVKHLQGRLANGIYGDPVTGLIFSPSHYTWMDTNYPAGTPRQGYPVEIQALWIHALKFIADITGQHAYRELQARAQDSFLKLFVRKDGRGLCDCLHGQPGQGARQCLPDDAIRPNQLLAVTLGDFLPREVAESVVHTCQGLLIPGGIRSLDDEPVSFELPIVRDGVLLNDPRHPYQGRYAGDEDTRRKAAYHNGTGWGWQFPLFSEALFSLWGDEARAAASSWLNSVICPMTRFCLGHIPEIYDGDAPHAGRGCPAQAWSMFESYRVWKLLQDGE